MSTEKNQENEQIKEDIPEDHKKKTSLTAKILNSMSVKIVAVIGIICTLILQNYTNLFVETFFPKVHFEVDSEIPHFPTIHLLSDPEGAFIPATLNYKLPIFFTLENDNRVHIYIDYIFLVVDSFQKIPRDSFLLIRDYFNQGDAPVISLGTTGKINSSTDIYAFSMRDLEEGKTADDKYLKLDAGDFDRYRPDIDFEDEGLYTFHFEVHYRIHGQKHKGKSNRIKIMNIRGKEYEYKNPDNPELRKHLVESNSVFKAYGDGTVVFSKDSISGDHSGDALFFALQEHNYLFKKIEIEESTEEVGECFRSLIGGNIKEIALPRSLKTIRDGVFEDGHVSSKMIIAYNGTYDEWRDNVKIGKNNNALYGYDFKFKDGFIGHIYPTVP